MKFTLRLPESEAKYQVERAARIAGGCPMCNAPTIEEWKYWKIIRNDYPYDLVAEKHDLLVLKEHTSTISKNAWIEFNERKYALQDDPYAYHSIIENLPVRQSFPAHFHYHLIRYKP